MSSEGAFVSKGFCMRDIMPHHLSARKKDLTYVPVAAVAACNFPRHSSLNLPFPPSDDRPKYGPPPTKRGFNGVASGFSGGARAKRSTPPSMPPPVFQLVPREKNHQRGRKTLAETVSVFQGRTEETGELLLEEGRRGRRQQHQNGHHHSSYGANGRTEGKTGSNPPVFPSPTPSLKRCAILPARLGGPFLSLFHQVVYAT